MKQLYFLTFALVVSVTTAFSQASNCTQVLRLVRSTYESGRLHELPALAEGCLISADPTKSFSKEEKKEAYRYLTLAYIYLEEPEKADETMLKLIDTDHFYRPNLDIDPAEFIALFNKFRTDPVYRIGLTLGLNATQAAILNNYYIGSEAVGQGKYSFSLAFSGYVIFEKDITKKIVLAAEVGYISRAFNYENPSLNKLDSVAPNKVTNNQKFAFTQNWLDLNVIGQYKIKNTLDFQAYVGLGPGISYMLGSSNLPNTFLSNGFTVTGASVDDTKSYNSLVYSAILVAGLKFRIGDLYATANVRYQFGISNVMNNATRTNTEIAYAYQGSYNDYRMSNFSINAGILYPIFKPKKLIK